MSWRKRLVAVFFCLSLISNLGIALGEHAENVEVQSIRADNEVQSTVSGWSEDYEISYAEDQKSPALAVNGSYAHVVWRNFTGVGYYEIHYRRSEDYGQRWLPDMRISNASGEYTGEPSIALNGSTLHIVYEQSTASGRDEIFYTRSIDNGDTWTEPVQISEGNNSDSEWPHIAVEGDNTYVIWGDERDGQYEIYFKNSSDGGETWSIDRRLTTYILGTDTSLGLAISGVNIHVLFNRYVGNVEIFYMNSTDGGQTWNNPVMISPADGANSGVSDIAVNGSQVHIVWDDRRHFDGGEIYYRNSTNGGLTWNDEVRLTSNDNGSWNPSVDVEGDDVHVAFHDDRNKPAVGGDIFYLNSTNGGSTWSTLLQLTSEPHPVSSAGPKIAVESSFIHIVFQDNRSGQKEIFYKRSPPFQDTEPPTIQHTPITEANLSEEINITVKVTDDVWIDNVTLFWL